MSLLRSSEYVLLCVVQLAPRVHAVNIAHVVQSEVSQSAGVRGDDTDSTAAIQ